MNPSRLLAISLLLAGPASAQNLLQNGDFTQGLAQWTVRGTATSVQPLRFDVSGLGASDAVLASLRRSERAELVQRVTLLPGVLHELTFDVAVEGPRTNGAPMPEVQLLLGGVPQGAFHVDAKQWDFSRLTWRSRGAIRVPVQPAGPVELTVVVRNEASDPMAGPTSYYLDDLSLLPAFDPVTVIAGDRVPGGAVQLRILGTPGAAVAGFLAAARLAAPIPIPGGQGAWELHPTGAMLAHVAVVPASGQADLGLAVPEDLSLVGAVVWLQGVQATPAGISAGPAHGFAVHS